MIFRKDRGRSSSPGRTRLRTARMSRDEDVRVQPCLLGGGRHLRATVLDRRPIDVLVFCHPTCLRGVRIETMASAR